MVIHRGATHADAEFTRRDRCAACVLRSGNPDMAGGIREGVAGHDACFIHRKGSDASPIGGEGVLIELVQAPPEVVAALG